MTGARLPDWIVVGAMKSGTTTVARWLKWHPEGWLVENKEVHYFNRDDVFARGREWYEELFADAPPGARVGEASPSYLFSPHAPERMAALVPEARLVVCARDPVERAYSHYWHNRHRGLETRTFADATAAEMRDPQWRSPGYLMRGRYHAQLERLLEHYPREAILVVFTADLASAPAATFALICRHVGVSESEPPPNDGRAENTYREHRAERLYAAMFRYRLWRWLPARARPRVAALFTREATYPPLASEESARLLHWFDADDAALARWVGREVPWR